MNDSRGWWYKDTDGTWPKEAWKKIKYNNREDWYYFDAEGYMNAGWKLLNNSWYYMNESSDGTFPKGAMVTGWKQIGGKWYYFHEKSEGLVQKGSMAKSVKIDNYLIDENGVWVP